MTPDEFNKAVRAEAERVLATYKAEVNKLIAAEVNANVQALKADMLELSTSFDKVKDLLATGKGLQGASSVGLGENTYKRLAPQRIQASSLQEIADYVEGR